MAKKKAEGETPKTNGDGPSEAPSPGPEAAPRAGEQPQLTVLAQYIKDLSFESPSAPQSLQGPGQNPQLKVGVNVNAGARGEDAYEVALQLEVHAKSDQGVIYNVELVYGGLFRLTGVPQNLLQPVLFVDCPTLLFTFLRRASASVSTTRSHLSSGRAARSSSALRKPKSKAALCITSTAPSKKASMSSASSAKRGLSRRNSVESPCTSKA